jgi:hypothetical protein
MADMKKGFCNGLCHRVFHYRRYDRPLLRNECYRTSPIWEVTMAEMYDIQGLGGGGGER